MEERRGKVCLMTFIRPHRSGFALSVVLAIISVASMDWCRILQWQRL